MAEYDEKGFDYTEEFTVVDDRRPGWHWISNWVIDDYAAKIGVYAFGVYVAIVRHGSPSWPSVRRIAKQLGISTRTVVNGIRVLEEHGLIRVERGKRPDGSNLSNVYHVLGDAGGVVPATTGVVHEVQQKETSSLNSSLKGEGLGRGEGGEEGSDGGLPFTEEVSSESRALEVQTPEVVKPAMELAGLLRDSIYANNTKSKAISDGNIRQWAEDIDKLNRLDGQSWESIKEVMEWSQKDPFWSVNILSGRKLREKWNTLTAHMNRRDGSLLVGSTDGEDLFDEQGKFRTRI